MKAKNTRTMTIGKLAELGGVSTDTLRYYEKQGLIRAESRSATGYRQYGENSVQVLQFICRAKALNFSLEKISQLLALNSSDKATCAEIISFTESKIAEAEAKIKEMKEIKRVLTDLIKRCPGGKASIEVCPIIDHIRMKNN